MEAPFTYDDSRIYDNPNIRIEKLSLEEIKKAAFNRFSAKDRPLGNLTFALNFYFHQNDLPGYHLVNIAVHILTGFLLYLFINTTLYLTFTGVRHRHPESPAVAVALIWLVHPLNTQSVTYIIQRLNSMAALFFVLSLFLYAKGRMMQRHSTADHYPESRARLKDKNEKHASSLKSTSGTPHRSPWIYFSCAFLSWLVSLGCKQISATLPFFVLLYEWYFFRDLDTQWMRRHLKYLFALFLLFGFIALVYLSPNPIGRLTSLNDFANKEFTYSERVLSQFRVVIYYLSLIFYPQPGRLNLIYDFPLSRSLLDPITTLFSLFAIVGLLGFAIFIAKKHRLISFCILWFFGNLVIESSVIPLAVIFEHRTYLPSMLVVLAAVSMVYPLLKSKWPGIVLLCSVLAVCSVWTYQRNTVWKDGVTLWRDNVAKSPNKYLPQYNLGNALLKEGRTNEAVEYYSEALRLNPDYAKAHVNLGNALVALDRSDEAVAHFREALRLAPKNSSAHNNLAIELSRQGALNEAIRHFSIALQLDPGNASARNNLEKTTMVKKRLDSAVSETNYRLNLHPDDPGLYFNLGNLYKSMGELETAAKQYEKALSIRPDFIAAVNNLAIVYLKASKPDKALAMFEKMAEIDPDNAAAYYNVACIHARLNRVDLAVDWLKKAVDKGYKNWELIQTDRDLENIRDSAYYKELITNQNR